MTFPHAPAPSAPLVTRELQTALANANSETVSIRLHPSADELSATLARHPYFRMRPLSVEATEGRVVLQGVVATYYHKQVAQEMIRKIDGVHAVENRLHVAW